MISMNLNDCRQKDRDRAETSEDQFYLQDSRSYVGNDILWWAKYGKGYTTDLRKAEVFTRSRAFRQNAMRETDRPWPKQYIDERTRPVVDMQYADLKQALGSEYHLVKHPPKPKRETYRCYYCGIFLSQEQYYCGSCQKCGGDNRP